MYMKRCFNTWSINRLFELFVFLVWSFRKLSWPHSSSLKGHLMPDVLLGLSDWSSFDNSIFYPIWAKSCHPFYQHWILARISISVWGTFCCPIPRIILFLYLSLLLPSLLPTVRLLCLSNNGVVVWSWCAGPEKLPHPFCILVSAANPQHS